MKRKSKKTRSTCYAKPNHKEHTAPLAATRPSAAMQRNGTTQRNTNDNNDRRGTATADTTRRMIDFLQSGYALRYNSVMKCTEYHAHTSAEGSFMPLDQRTRNRMAIEAKLTGIDVSTKDVRDYIESDFHARLRSSPQATIAEPAEQYFHTVFEPANDESEGEWLSVAEIFDTLKRRIGHKIPRKAAVRPQTTRQPSTP